MIHIDFETFSTAGYRWHPVLQKWTGLEGCSKSGLPSIGVEPYATHPSTRVVCLAWGDKLWWPGEPPPMELWDRVAEGETLAAWNSLFEFWIWNEVLAKRCGWPKVKLSQLVDGMPRARAWSMPGALGNVAKVLQIDAQKDTKGKSLMRKFSMPRAPTKLDSRLTVMPAEAPEDAKAYGQYCLTDVVVETALSRALPQLSPMETKVWELDQRINVRGIPVDVVAIDHAAELLRQAERILNAELNTLTNGCVPAHSLIAKLTAWCNGRGAQLVDLTADTVTECLERTDLDPGARRALEIRQSLSSVSTKKVWAFKARTLNGRVYGQKLYCGADRTGRWTASGCQVDNFPRGPSDWESEEFIADLACRDYHQLAAKWGDPLKALSNSLRGMIKASDGHRLVVADYSAIEAVVLAVLAGEQWRIDVFKGDGRIYESSASKITGTSVEEYADYKAVRRKHHPDRALGKLSELASGYQGGVGAWKNFGAEAYFTPERCEPLTIEWQSHCAWMRSKHYDPPTLQDYAIGLQVKAWRKASPAIVSFWADVQAAAVNAVKNPGVKYPCRDVSYVVEHGTLYCQLPSGRRLSYHQATIVPGRFGGDAIAFKGWNTNAKMGPMGWVTLTTFGGKLVENITQAVARDILAWGMLRADAAGYAIGFTVHDEIIAEMVLGVGSVKGLIHCMLDLPKWAAHYPLGCEGWEGPRFRK